MQPAMATPKQRPIVVKTQVFVAKEGRFLPDGCKGVHSPTTEVMVKQ
jgi:hypothetical protein